MFVVLCLFLKQKKWTILNDFFSPKVMFKGLTAVETMQTSALFHKMIQAPA